MRQSKQAETLWPLAPVSEEENMRTLAMYEPFCSLLPLGKQETRRRPTNVRGPVLFYSTKEFIGWKKVERIAGAYQTARILDACAVRSLEPLRMGHGLCVANLVGCHRMRKEDEEECWVQWQEGLWVWELRECRKIRPIPWVHPQTGLSIGQQGWGLVPPYIKQQIVYV